MLTQAQIDILKPWIIANVPNPTEFTAQAALNADASPDYWCYKTKVSRREVLENGFDWTRLDNLSVGKARIWDEIFLPEEGSNLQTLNPSKSNVRAGINAVWVGTAQDLAVRAVVYGHCQRKATVAEKLLKASGAGTFVGSSGEGPAVLGFSGLLTIDEVISAMP